MIRINLLGEHKAKHGKGGGVPSVAGDGPNPLVIILLIVLVAGGGNYYAWHKLTAERDRLAVEIQKAEEENRRLAPYKAKFEEAQRQKEIFQRRADIIGKLRSDQAGPVNLLTTIGDTVNATDAVWLSSMKDDGASISLEGTALSANAVANLITNLRKSPYFKSVEIKETVQDDNVKDMQAFTFTLVCEKQQDKKS